MSPAWKAPSVPLARAGIGARLVRPAPAGGGLGRRIDSSVGDGESRSRASEPCYEIALAPTPGLRPSPSRIPERARGSLRGVAGPGWQEYRSVSQRTPSIGTGSLRGAAVRRRGLRSERGKG